MGFTWDFIARGKPVVVTRTISYELLVRRKEHRVFHREIDMYNYD